MDIVGRRGHVQSSFTIKELRELSRLEGTSLRLLETELIGGSNEASVTEAEETRSKKRILDLLKTLATQKYSGCTEIMLRFLLQPKEIICRENGAVEGVRFERTRLVGPPYRQRAQGTGHFEVLPCDLVIKSLGYLNTPFPGLPFDSNAGAIPHLHGRISDNGHVVTGWYVTGWLKRGPTGNELPFAGIRLKLSQAS